MAQQKTMSLIEFMKQFGTEEICHQHLFNMRWPEGFVCPERNRCRDGTRSYESTASIKGIR